MSETEIFQPEDSQKPEKSIDTHAPAQTAYVSLGGGNAPSLKESQDDLSGRKLGEFLVIRKLGKGGMANVYLAEQTALNRHVAIKVMKSSLVSDAVYLERFKTEAMAAANLNHVNIVQVYTIGSEEGYHFIAQEYVQGKNLKEFITRKGTPELSIAMHIMRQIASALQKAGEAGIVHRDIKPENILINRQGVVKIADFGLAQLTLGGERLNLTQDGTTMGTPLYMSPEQVQGNRVDHRSDIYSFGVTCYHLLTGRPPFRGETALAIAMKHVNSEPIPLSKRRPDLPAPVCELVHRMMAKKPDDRFPDATALLNEIRKISKTVQATHEEFSLSGISTPVVSKPEKQPSPAPKAWKRSRLIGLSLAFLLLGGLAGWAGRPRIETESQYPATNRAQSREQLADAVLQGSSEEAWKAVRNYHPHSPERWRAEERLAILYLNQGRIGEASKLFETFLEQQASGDQFNLIPSGYAGRAVIAAMKGDYQKADEILSLNINQLSTKLDGPMKPLVRETILENSKHLDKPRVTLEKMFPEAAAGSPEETNGN